MYRGDDLYNNDRKCNNNSQSNNALICRNNTTPHSINIRIVNCNIDNPDVSWIVIMVASMREICKNLGTRLRNLEIENMAHILFFQLYDYQIFDSLKGLNSGSSINLIYCTIIQIKIFNCF